MYFLKVVIFQVYVPRLSEARPRTNSNDLWAPISLQRRQKLSYYNSIDDAVDLIHKSRNILVLTGAGISKQTSAILRFTRA